MKLLTKRLLSALIALMMAITMILPATATTSETDEPVPDAINRFAGRVVGYLPYYRMEYIDSIDFSAVTHVILSFLTYKSGTFGFEFTDEDIQRVKEKCDANGVKLLIALGGGGGFSIGDDPFSTEEGTKEFVDQIMSYVDKYDLDGVDIDTEIESGTYWNSFDTFMEELSGRLKPDGKLLTMAVSPWFTGSIANSTYDYFDFVNVMAYDENAGTGPVASMEFMYEEIQHFMDKGISVDRLVVGVPFYGYVKNGGWNGGKTYAEILADNIDNRLSDYSESFGGVYYNGEATIREKAEISKNYGGIMIWEIGQDSFDEYSLLAIVKDVMTEGGTISTMTPPSNLMTTAVTASTVSFSWTAAPEAVNYEVYQGSELLGTTTSTSYNAMNLSPLTSYIFKVAAVSATGEVSKKVTLGVTMPAGAASDFETWSASVGYAKDTYIAYEGKVYHAKWYSVNEEPGGAHYYAWEYVGDVAPDDEKPIIISTDKISLDVGETTTIAASTYPADTTYTWSTSDESVATISNGVITAVSAGTATLTASTANGDTASCTVTVAQDGEVVEPDPEPEEADVFVFKIYDTNVYYVNQNMKFAVDAPAQLVNGKTLVPLRAIGSAVGIDDLAYSGNTITFTGYNGYAIEMTIGSTVCTLTKDGTSMDITITAPVLIDGITMLPLRDATALIGGTVKFDDAGTTDTGYVVVSAGTFDDTDVTGYINAYEAI